MLQVLKLNLDVAAGFGRNTENIFYKYFNNIDLVE